MIDVRIAEFRIRRRSTPQRFFTAVLGERGGLDHLRDAEAHVVRRGDRLRLARGDQHRGSGWVCSPWIFVFLQSQDAGIIHSYGPLPVISTYNPIYRMYNPIYNQL